MKGYTKLLIDMYQEPPQTIQFRHKTYNFYGSYDKKHEAQLENEALHSQGIKTHTVPWMTRYNIIYTLEMKK
jgi:hypothetical protein